MSELSGSLADFTLSAVVRLLAAGSKTGILVVNGPHFDGSVFLDVGEMTFATTRKPADGHEPPEADRRGESVVSSDEIIADVLTCLTREGGGSFTFQADIEPVHDVNDSYPVESILEMVEGRMEVWRDIVASLGSTDQPYAMVPQLDSDEKVELTGLEWNLLAAMGPDTSVRDLWMTLRLPELNTAEVIVRLKNDGLVVEGHLPTRVSESGPAHNGGRLIQPDFDDLVISITDASLASQARADEREAPASELAARWRSLRDKSRDDAPNAG